MMVTIMTGEDSLTVSVGETEIVIDAVVPGDDDIGLSSARTNPGGMTSIFCFGDIFCCSALMFQSHCCGATSRGEI